MTWLPPPPRSTIAVCVGLPFTTKVPLPAAALAADRPRDVTVLVIFQFGADLVYANAMGFAADMRALVEAEGPPVKGFVIDAGAITQIDYSAHVSSKTCSETSFAAVSLSCSCTPMHLCVPISIATA